jgi:hypothetical protein
MVPIALWRARALVVPYGLAPEAVGSSLRWAGAPLPGAASTRSPSRLASSAPEPTRNRTAAHRPRPESDPERTISFAMRQHRSALEQGSHSHCPCRVGVRQLPCWIRQSRPENGRFDNPIARFGTRSEPAGSRTLRIDSASARSAFQMPESTLHWATSAPAKARWDLELAASTWRVERSHPLRPERLGS